MKRRHFIETTAGVGTALAALSGCQDAAQKETKRPQTQPASEPLKLAGHTLEELRELYRYDLYDDLLPFLDKYVVDHEYGGFMCNTDRDGTNITKNKRTWFEGRGIWVYSFLYNTLEKDPKNLEIARKSGEFILKHNPTGKELLPPEFTREGKPIGKPDPIFYGDMFIAEGLQEFSKASGDDSYWDMAKKIMLKCLDIYDNRPDYGNLPPKQGIPGVTRPRMLGHWFVLLRCGTQMLEKRPDPDIEGIVQRCIDAIVNSHFNPDYRLNNEYLNHDMTRIENDYGQGVSGHGLEVLWMVMFEAIRKKDKTLFDTAAERLKRHMEVLWDDVYGGLLAGLDHVDKYIWSVSQKSLWLQEEALIGSLCVIEHTGAQWAKDWFSQVYTYVREKFPLKQYGFPLWIVYADRKITFERHYDRVENYHHPRHLMLNFLMLDRMIERGWKVSGVFS